MNDLEQLKHSLSMLSSKVWINQYCDLAKRLLQDLHLSEHDERVALTLPKNARLPVNLGQRYVLLPGPNEIVRCIVPLDFEPEAVSGETLSYFQKQYTDDAKWVSIHYTVGSSFPEVLYQACLEECKYILRRTKKSGYRKLHKGIVYDFITETVVRDEILSELEMTDTDSPTDPKLTSTSNYTLNAFLLTWNPKNFEWDDLQDLVEQVKDYGKATMKWSCSHTKNIKPGDRIFLMRLGDIGDKGIMASGYARTTPFQAKHFSLTDKQTNYVQVEFDVLIDPELDPVLPLQNLKTGDLGNQLWTPQNSGISIKPELISKLETTWFDHLMDGNFRYNLLNDDNQALEGLLEGFSYQVNQTRYERNPEARRQCLNHFGYACCVCQFDFEKIFGELGKKFIHVHHLRQIAHAGGRYEIKPVRDLRPVCPNCHAMLHRTKEGLSIETLKELLKGNQEHTN